MFVASMNVDVSLVAVHLGHRSDRNPAAQQAPAVADGPNLATVACDTVKPSTDANGVRTVYSQFALKQFAQGKRTLKCAAGTPWTWCLNKPCTVDPANPKKAICACDVLAPANGSRQGAIATRRRARPRIGPAPLSMIST